MLLYPPMIIVAFYPNILPYFYVEIDRYLYTKQNHNKKRKRHQWPDNLNNLDRNCIYIRTTMWWYTHKYFIIHLICFISLAIRVCCFHTPCHIFSTKHTENMCAEAQFNKFCFIFYSFYYFDQHWRNGYLPLHFLFVSYTSFFCYTAVV